MLNYTFSTALALACERKNAVEAISSSVKVAPLAGLRTGTGYCNGTFGELLQGQLPGPEDYFLVTLPVSRYSQATFTPLAGCSELLVLPAYKQKSRRLVKRILDFYGLPPGGILQIKTELPEGKGCASSSADLVATARSLENAFGFALSPERLALFMAEIEPSDGVMYQGVVSYYHRKGRLRRAYGHLKSLVIVAVDEGGQVDTLEYNRKPPRYSPAERAIYANLLDRLEQAIIQSDVAAVGEVATQSALLNQARLPKSYLDLFLELRGRYRAPGVVAAHSGTCTGLLLNPASPGYP